MPDQQGPSELATMRGSVLKKKTNHAHHSNKERPNKQEPEAARLIVYQHPRRDSGHHQKHRGNFHGRPYNLVLSVLIYVSLYVRPSHTNYTVGKGIKITITQRIARVW